MPAFNAAPTIAAAIASVRWQTDSDWELIIVNDGSTDRTLQVAEGAIGDDRRVRILTVDHKGRGEARNICLLHARGDFIVVCDADDISLQERFQSQRRYLEQHPEVSVVSASRVISFTPHLADSFVAFAPRGDAEIRRAFGRGRMPILFASAMMRRVLFKRFGTFDAELHRSQDYGFLSRIYQEVRFATMGEPLILYRTPGRTVDCALVAENNYYRYYANRRSRGEQRPAAEVRVTLRGAAYRHLVAPLQFLWYVVKRRLLQHGVSALTPADRHLLESTLGALPDVTAQQTDV